MEKSDPQLLAGISAETLFIRFRGRATHLFGRPLRDLMTRIMDSGCHRIVLDLAACTYMDSTFVGTVVAASIRLRKLDSPGSFVLWRPTPGILAIFRSLGILSFFQVSPNSVPESVPEILHPVVSSNTDLQWGSNVLTAHETLADINEENAGQFKEVIQHLRDDLLKRQEQLSSDQNPGKVVDHE